MRVFHAESHRASRSKERGAQALQRLSEQVNACRARAVSGEDLEQMERELHALFVEAEREVLGETLERLDVDLPFIEIDGRRHYRVLGSSETYTTAVGPVQVRRTLYRCGRGRAVVPMELRAGIIEGHWTALAARQANYLVAHLTPQECESMLRELGNMTPSKSSLDRLPKGVSARWEAQRASFEASLREGYEVAGAVVTVAVSLDGVMVPMKDGNRAAKRAHARAAGRCATGAGGVSGGGVWHGVVLRCRGRATRHRAHGADAAGEEGDVEEDVECRA